MYRANNRRLNTIEKKLSGFSIPELMLVITIIGIAVAIIIPLSLSFIKSNRSDAYLKQVKSAAELARMTAMSQGVSAILCPVSDNDNCTTVTNDNWGNHPIKVFTREANGADEILTTIDAPIAEDYVLWSGRPNVDYIEFRANGFSSANGSLKYCTRFSNRNIFQANKKLVINRIGRIRLENINPVQDC